MNSGVSTTWSQRSGLKISRASQDQLLGAIEDKRTSPKDISLDTHHQRKKRQLNEVEIKHLRAKKARWVLAAAPHDSGQGGKTEQAEKQVGRYDDHLYCSSATNKGVPVDHA
jgi:hypothetical protein